MDKAHPNGPVILIVDDNPHNLQVLGNLLREEKYEIEFAVSGEATLDWLKNRQFDLILLDINMPGMNGFEVCKKIRSNKETHEIPIIFLSAESERESILKGFEVGAQDFVIKPFDSRELLARVKTQLDLKSKTEKLEKINDWLGKKIDNWLKMSVDKPGSSEATDLSAKLIEFDKNQSYVLKDICLELNTSIKEIEKLIGKSFDSKNKSQFKEIVKADNRLTSKTREIVYKKGMMISDEKNSPVDTPLILIVDDNPKNLQVLGNYLQLEGYLVEFALNGESALDWIRKAEFDLILLDIMMPGMDGFEVCKIIKRDPLNQKTPIIFLTAKIDTESIVNAFDLGAVDYIIKPFNQKELIARVKTQIEIKRSRDRNCNESEGN